MKTWLCLALCLVSCLARANLPPWQAPDGRDDPYLGQVLDTASGRWLSAQALVERLAGTPQVLIGEKHDNPDHHRLQLWLLDALHARRAQAAVVMEMLEPQQQERVYGLQGQPLGEDLQAQLQWGHGWDWGEYAPLVRWGLTYPHQLLAGNLSREEMLAFYREPQPLAPVYDDAARSSLARTLRDAHCQKLPEAHLPAMLSIQQARDQRMAEVLLNAPTPSVLLAGNFHVRKDLGVPLHWPPAATPPAVVMLIEAGMSRPGAAEADFVWITPATPVRDYCQDIP